MIVKRPWATTNSFWWKHGQAHNSELAPFVFRGKCPSIRRTVASCRNTFFSFQYRSLFLCHRHFMHTSSILAEEQQHKRVIDSEGLDPIPTQSVSCIPNLYAVPALPQGSFERTASTQGAKLLSKGVFVKCMADRHSYFAFLFFESQLRNHISDKNGSYSYRAYRHVLIFQS